MKWVLLFYRRLFVLKMHDCLPKGCFLLIKSTSFIPDKMQTIRKKLCHSKTPGTSNQLSDFSSLLPGLICNLRPYSSANYGAKSVQEVKKQHYRHLLKTTRIERFSFAFTANAKRQTAGCCLS